MTEESHRPPEDIRAAREKILAAAARLFAERGYESTSLAQVARAAKVSKALIFWHFDNKRQLYLSALQKNLEPYHIDREELAGLEEPEQIGRLIESFYQFVNDNVYSVRFFMTLMLRGELASAEPSPGGASSDSVQRVNGLYRAFRESFAEIIARGQQRRVFRPELDPAREAALILVTLVGVLAQQFMLGESPLESKALIDHYKQALFQRLRAHAGQES
ncbi:MAG: TetR/AcrR family transcriptional regulator [Candidatus Binatia bacterium]|nr:TetR/AcrR family transcriptional regulator [Candidatus Binatia bacterium]